MEIGLSCVKFYERFSHLWLSPKNILRYDFANKTTHALTPFSK